MRPQSIPGTYVKPTPLMPLGRLESPEAGLDESPYNWYYKGERMGTELVSRYEPDWENDKSDGVAIVSGGLDSITTAYHLVHLGKRPHLLSFDYGQRHLKELQYALWTAERLGLRWSRIDLSSITDLISNSALTSPPQPTVLDRNTATVHSRIEVPEGHYCLAPGTKVLCTDLVWRNIEDLAVGDKVVGFDEELRSGQQGKPASKLQESTVTATSVKVLPCARIVLETGQEVVASYDHLWVARRGRSGGGLATGRRWRKTYDPTVTSGPSGHSLGLMPGDTLSLYLNPWEVQTDSDAGYLAGFMDGEATLHDTNFQFSQNPGETLERVKVALKKFGFQPSEGFKNTKETKTECLRFRLEGEQTALRFVGMFQPTRFRQSARRLWEGRWIAGSRTRPVRVVSVEPVGNRAVVALGTSTSTLIADGYLSHNSADNMAITVVPNRNMMMFSIAAAVAVNAKYRYVAAGMHAGDHYQYPDCRPIFMHSVLETLQWGNEGFIRPNFEILVPFIHLSKDDIAAEAYRRGVPLELTWSCYRGNEIHCGRCGTCVERLEAIASVTKAPKNWDKTQYADTEFWKEAVAEGPQREA